MSEAAEVKNETSPQANKPRRRRNNNRNRNQNQQRKNANSSQQQRHSKQASGDGANHSRRKSQGSSAKHKHSKPAKVASVTTQKEVAELLLPTAAALHEFEYALEGGAERVLEIAKAEQAHRHQWENHALKSQVKSQRLGLLFGGVIALIALFLVQAFADAGYVELAKITAISVFGTFSLAILLAFFKGSGK